MVTTALAGPPPVQRRVELPQGVIVSVPWPLDFNNIQTHTHIYIYICMYIYIYIFMFVYLLMYLYGFIYSMLTFLHNIHCG